MNEWTVDSQSQRGPGWGGGSNHWKAQPALGGGWVLGQKAAREKDLLPHPFDPEGAMLQAVPLFLPPVPGRNPSRERWKDTKAAASGNHMSNNSTVTAVDFSGKPTNLLKCS